MYKQRAKIRITRHILTSSEVAPPALLSVFFIFALTWFSRVVAVSISPPMTSIMASCTLISTSWSVAMPFNRVIPGRRKRGKTPQRAIGTSRNSRNTVLAGSDSLWRGSAVGAAQTLGHQVQLLIEHLVVLANPATASTQSSTFCEPGAAGLGARTRGLLHEPPLHVCINRFEIAAPCPPPTSSTVAVRPPNAAVATYLRHGTSSGAAREQPAAIARPRLVAPFFKHLALSNVFCSEIDRYHPLVKVLLSRGATQPAQRAAMRSSMMGILGTMRLAHFLPGIEGCFSPSQPVFVQVQACPASPDASLALPAIWTAGTSLQREQRVQKGLSRSMRDARTSFPINIG